MAGQVVAEQEVVQTESLVVSTAAALGGGGSYTSPLVNLKGWCYLVGTLYADQDGTLYVDQSQDGSNFDVRSTFAYTASVPDGFMVSVVAPYGRIVYTNGAAAQGTFRLNFRLRRP